MISHDLLVPVAVAAVVIVYGGIAATMIGLARSADAGDLTRHLADDPDWWYSDAPSPAGWDYDAATVRHVYIDLRSGRVIDAWTAAWPSEYEWMVPSDTYDEAQR